MFLLVIVECRQKPKKKRNLIIKISAIYLSIFMSSLCKPRCEKMNSEMIKKKLKIVGKNFFIISFISFCLIAKYIFYFQLSLLCLTSNKHQKKKTKTFSSCYEFYAVFKVRLHVSTQTMRTENFRMY